MEIVSCPIVDFYKNCLGSAKDAGFEWIITIVAREADADELFRNVRYQWHSLDSVTGKHMLVIFAGRENIFVENNQRYRITDWQMEWASIYNKFITIMNPKAYLQGNIYDCTKDNFKSKLDGIPETQTVAVESLRKYFKLPEEAIPCLHFWSLRTGKKWIIPITAKSDVYGYFKELRTNIEPLLEAIEHAKETPILHSSHGNKINAVIDDLFDSVENIMRGTEMVEIMNEEKNAVHYTENNDFRGAIIVGSVATGGNSRAVWIGDNKASHPINDSAEDKFDELLKAVKKAIPEDAAVTDVNAIHKQLGYLEKDVEEKKPYKGFMERAIDTLKSLSTATQFVCAVNELAEYLMGLFK